MITLCLCAAITALCLCAACATGAVEVPLVVSFKAVAVKGLAIPPLSLTLVAAGRELPVYAETAEVDFRWAV